LSLWARVFSERGKINPEHVASNFGQGGNFDYNQRNSGVEGGVDFAFNDEFSLGLLLGKADGSQHLTGLGVGTSKFTGTTYGIYGTWISPVGFYLDASYRRMNFHDRLNSIAGNMEVHGDANAFNIEAGYAWTLASGLKIEPQAQYTNTKVDKIGVLVMPLATFVPNGGTSSRGRVGVAFRQSFGDPNNGTMWTPYATISAVREFDGKNTFSINNNFFGETSTRGTSALLELGLTAQTGNLSIYGGINWEDGGALKSVFGGQLGARYTFGHAPTVVVAAPAAPAKTCADLDDDGDGVNNCMDKCPTSTAGQAVGPDGCPVPAPEPEPVPEPKPFRG
jgi:outer membrane autotransporter protein